MNRIALVDVDGRNFPNLALMKLSASHKAQGDAVEWYSPLFSRPDRIYASKVFSFTPDFQDYAAGDPEPIRGGTGYDPAVKLPDEVERTLPDYSIYPDWTSALGFLTRGCIRNCPWCIVPKKEGGLQEVDDIERIAAGRKSVVLLDNNFLAADEEFVREQLEKAARLGLRLDFNQGLDARLVRFWNAKLLARCRWMRFIRFSCDTMEVLHEVRAAVEVIRGAGYRGEFFCYMLVQDDLEDAEYRLRELVKLKVTPFAQPYRDFSGKAETTKAQRDFARFANVKGGKLCLKMSFKEYYH